MISDAVNSHGIIFISSVGNDGPALNTVDNPTAACDAIVGVGAFLSPSMMVREDMDVER